MKAAIVIITSIYGLPADAGKANENRTKDVNVAVFIRNTVISHGETATMEFFDPTDVGGV